ncbi:hypothetical protein ACHWQZ_G012503 [Mnemiopsis leidyi]
MKVNGEGKPERLALFAQTDSELSDSDPEETEFEREFIDINRRRSLRKHKENSATLSPNGLSSNKNLALSECSVSPISNLSGRSHISAKTPSSGLSSTPGPGRSSRLSQLNKDDLSDTDSEEPLYITKPSSHLLCNICNRVLRRPVITQCGHTYCARCVMSGNVKECPVDGQDLALVVENIALREQIGGLTVYCKFGCAMKEGGEKVYTGQACTDKITFHERKFHEAQCPWSIVPCPNSDQCGTLLARDLTEHLVECQHATCENVKYGCDFKGTSRDVDTHQADCKFMVVRGVIESFRSTIDNLVVEVSKQSKQIRELRKAVISMEQENIQRDRKLDLKLASLDESQSHCNTSLDETRQMVNEISTEMNNVQSQLGLVGNIEQHVFKCKGTFVGHDGPIWSMASSGDLLFSGSSDHTIKIWDTLANFTCLKTLQGHEGMVLALCVSNGVLYSSASDNKICVWDIKSYRLLESFSAHSNPVCTLAANDRYVFSGSLRVINVWDVATFQAVHTIDNLNHWVRALVIKKNKLYAGIYQAIKIWDVSTFEAERIIDIKGGSVYSMVVTDSWIICGTYEKGIQMHSLHNTRESHVLTGHSGTVYCLGFYTSAGHTRLFSGANDRTIKVWNVDRKIPSQTLDRHQGSVCCLVVSKGKIFSGAMDSTIKVWQ